MEFDCERLRRLLGKYKFRDLTVEELKNVNMFFPHFRYSMDTYVFKDSSQKDLLNFTGTIPVMYQGNTYNIPIRLWILDSHPFAPPICFLKPTANMGISVGKHVDAQGRIYLPYLQNWSHPKSVIVGLVKEMIAKFQEELPLYSLSSSDEARQVDLLAYIAKITEGVSDINSKNWANYENKTINKITVVGGGELGVACTLAISAKGIADRLVLLDLSEGTKGGMMDLDIFNLPNVEISKDLSASAHSKVVIFTVNSLGSSQSYLGVVQSNVDLFRALVPALGHYSQHSVLLVASQPVEIMTYVTWKLSTFPANRVIGIGCNLDSQRLQYIITNVLKAQTSGKEVWVIGEQGEDKVTKWGGQEEVMSHLSQEQLSSRAMELLKVKGQRSWSVGLSVADLVDSLVNDKKKVHSVSILAKYKYRDLTVRETVNVITLYKDLKPVLDSYVFNDGSSRELMNLTGTIPVLYRGNTYNIPICLWLLDTYPYNPPICFVKPTSSMTIKTGKHVDANGKIYLPYLHEWKHPQSDLLGLIQVMIVVFGDEPPVFSRPTMSASYPPYQATGPPNTSYMPGMPSGISPFPSGYPPNPSGYPGCPYPAGGPYPATTSSQYPSQPPVTTVGPSRDGTISEDTIRASLISAVSDKLRWRMKEEMDRAQAELNALKRTEEDLKKGHQKLEEMVTRLDQEVAEVDKNIELLRKKDEELSSALEKMENQSENNDIDEVIIPTAPLYKQILNLYAEENAIEDTIFYLGEALRRGVIDLDVFLKHVRLLSRKQFQLRALMQKARKTAGLSDLY
uniref:Tumor susceptibility 101 n=1 Tax=Rhinolophus ferrumequinum TaxID=59479 RepID=A0A671G1Y9_RHIFE